jgi:hypothetical protein
MLEEIKQHTIEYFFKKYNIEDPDKKIKFLPLLTDIIYDYNMHVVKLEKENDDYKKQQILVGIQEILEKIDKIFKE